MSLKPAFWDTYLPLLERGAGAYSTGPVSAPGSANMLIVATAVTVVSGTTKTLDVVVQTSPDQSVWTTVASGAQLSAIGTQLLAAYVGSGLYAQILATVAGTGTPLVTFAVSALVM